MESDPGALWVTVNRLAATIESDKDTEITNLEQQVQQLRQEILQKDQDLQARPTEEQFQEVLQERDNYKDAIADIAVRQRGTTPSVAGVTTTAKVAKLPDPPILTDGKDPTYEDWSARMKSKLEGNADQYPTEALRMAYVHSRTGGKAAQHLEPRMREGVTNPFRTAQEIIE